MRANQKSRSAPFIGISRNPLVDCAGERPRSVATRSRCSEPVQFQLSGFLALDRAASAMGSANVL
jgi:hypothetical protein